MLAVIIKSIIFQALHRVLEENDEQAQVWSLLLWNQCSRSWKKTKHDWNTDSKEVMVDETGEGARNLINGTFSLNP